MTKKMLMLVDGSSYLYRAFYAMPDSMKNAQGERTGAIYGVINMLRSLIQTYQPAYIAVVFDAKGKTFRDELYPEYKAHRPPMPDDLRPQIEPLHHIIKAMGLPMLVIDGVEADDVIGTLAVQAASEGLETVISTGDKDMAQLVSGKVSLINTMNNQTMDEAGVLEKFLVHSHQIIDYLALVGDSADNIPGVPSVGPKTAAKWLAKYATIDGLIESADEVKGKVGEKLRANIEQLRLSQQLATIKLDVPLAVTVHDLVAQESDFAVLRDLYQQQGMNRWYEEAQAQLGSDGDEGAATTVSTEPVAAVEYEVIYSMDVFSQWLEKLSQASLFAFDLETTSLDYMMAEIVGLSFSCEPNHAAYVPLAHRYIDAPEQLSRDEVLLMLKPLLEDAGHKKAGQNLKYDMSVLANYDIALAGIQFDSMLESYVLNSTATRHDMDTLAAKYLQYQTTHFEDIAGKGAKQLTFDQIDIDVAAPYAAEDADVTLRLHQCLWEKLKQDEGTVKIFKTIEMPLLPVLSRMERNGVLIDVDMLNAHSVELLQRVGELEIAACEMAGQDFNLGSPKQLQEILFEKMALPVVRKTPKGQPSTAESVLQELAHDYPLPKLILEYRSLSKLQSTYSGKLPELICEKTGRIHTSYHQAVTATGRLSSSQPNLQNIPIRTSEGRRIRQAFIAPPGYKILAADYSQIELRIMAHLSQDAGLLNAFNAGEDIHRATAAEIFDVLPAAVTTDQRRSAKAINFGLIYGMSAFGLARQIDVGRHDAQAYMDRYFARYPAVQEFMDKTRALAHEQGYVETIYGRKLYLPDISSRDHQRRQYAERAAINAPMQGSAADIIKMAMIDMDRLINENCDHDMTMVMQVHDELVFEVRAEYEPEARKVIRRCMEAAGQLSVPMIVDIGAGDNWDEAH